MVRLGIGGRVLVRSGLSAVRWNKSGLISIEALVFQGGDCGSFPLGLLEACGSFVLPLGSWLCFLGSCRAFGPIRVLLVSGCCGSSGFAARRSWTDPNDPRGHFITKHTGGWLESLSQKPQNI